MRLKFIFISIIVILVCSVLKFAVLSREMTVKSFELLPADLTARTKEVIDLNGDRCALIKISLPERECRFDGSVVKQEYDISEYLVYVSPGTRKFQIKYSGIETLNLDLVELLGGESVKSGSTYRLGLTGYEDLNNEKPKNDIGGDFLVINITPKTNAIVKINGELQNVEDGQVMAFVRYGDYEYTIEAEGYSPQKGVAKVDRSGKTIINVKLESIKAQLSVNSETPGSIIKINNQEKGTDNFVGSLKPGYYKIEVQKEGYRPYVESIQLGPKETKNVKVPPLTPIFGTLKIAYNPVGAKINLDGKYIGETPMLLKEILIGSHTISFSKDGYKTFKTSILIEEGKISSLDGSLVKIISENNNSSGRVKNFYYANTVQEIEKTAYQMEDTYEPVKAVPKYQSQVAPDVARYLNVALEEIVKLRDFDPKDVKDFAKVVELRRYIFNDVSANMQSAINLCKDTSIKDKLTMLKSFLEKNNKIIVTPDNGEWHKTTREGLDKIDEFIKYLHDFI